MATTQEDRFGTGLAMPFRRASAGDFVRASGPEKVQMCIAQILGTPIGKLPWRVGFGSRIERLRHMNNNNDMQQLARVDVLDGLSRWEPRCRVAGVTVAPRQTGARNVLDLLVTCTIAGKAVPQKLTI